MLLQNNWVPSKSKSNFLWYDIFNLGVFDRILLQIEENSGK